MTLENGATEVVRLFVDDKEQRAELTRALDQVQVPLACAVNAGHGLPMTTEGTPCEIAQNRVEAVLAALRQPLRPPRADACDNVRLLWKNPHLVDLISSGPCRH